MSKKKLPIKQKSEKEIDVLSLRDFRDKYLKKDKNGEYVPVLARDLTVQRKGVWSKEMKQQFFADVAVGDSDNNAVHYVDLESSRTAAEKTGQLDYAKHLNGFIDAGNIGTHIDGGNRTDSTYESLLSIIEMMPAIYNFGEQEDGSGVKYFTLEEPTFFKDISEDFRESILDNGALLICTYFGMSKKARKELFKKLNNGLPLNAAELRNCEESLVCELNRILDETYSNLLVKLKVLTETKASRWLTAEFFADLKYMKRNLFVNKVSGDVEVKTAGVKELDADYIVQSLADQNAKIENDFLIKGFISYLELLEKNELLLADKHLYIDFWLLLSYMDKEGYELTHVITNEKRLEFIRAFNDKAVEFFAETNKDYNKGNTKGVPTMVSFAGLYSKDNSLVLEQRLNRFIKDFLLTEDILFDKETGKGMIVKVTPRSGKTKSLHLKSRLIVKQKGVATISPNHEIDTLKINDGVTYNVDHGDDLRGGGADDEENMSIEKSRDNKVKGAVSY